MISDKAHEYNADEVTLGQVGTMLKWWGKYNYIFLERLVQGIRSNPPRSHVPLVNSQQELEDRLKIPLAGSS
ncbi:hypothetical protein J6590_023913 [Homalodisca vitripennis]|nr:hypothetical protein J6590_023913 [Homalodisca vitripennis]